MPTIKSNSVNSLLLDDTNVLDTAKLSLKEKKKVEGNEVKNVVSFRVSKQGVLSRFFTFKSTVQDHNQRILDKLAAEMFGVDLSADQRKALRGFAPQGKHRITVQALRTLMNKDDRPQLGQAVIVAGEIHGTLNKANLDNEAKQQEIINLMLDVDTIHAAEEINENNAAAVDSISRYFEALLGNEDFAKLNALFPNGLNWQVAVAHNATTIDERTALSTQLTRTVVHRLPASPDTIAKTVPSMIINLMKHRVIKEADARDYSAVINKLENELKGDQQVNFKALRQSDRMKELANALKDLDQKIKTGAPDFLHNLSALCNAMIQEPSQQPAEPLEKSKAIKEALNGGRTKIATWINDFVNNGIPSMQKAWLLPLVNSIFVGIDPNINTAVLRQTATEGLLSGQGEIDSLFRSAGEGCNILLKNEYYQTMDTSDMISFADEVAKNYTQAGNSDERKREAIFAAIRNSDAAKSAIREGVALLHTHLREPLLSNVSRPSDEKMKLLRDGIVGIIPHTGLTPWLFNLKLAYHELYQVAEDLAKTEKNRELGQYYRDIAITCHDAEKMHQDAYQFLKSDAMLSLRSTAENSAWNTFLREIVDGDDPNKPWENLVKEFEAPAQVPAPT
jgi:hypothetical protein